MLERLRSRLQSPAFDDKWLEQRKDIVRQFARAYDELAASLNFDVSTGQLKQESRLKAVRTLSKWSFAKSEVYSLLEKITRLQQYANTLLLEEQHSLIEMIDQRQQEAIDKRQRQAILSWVSPLQMTQVHQMISSRVEDGSGRWVSRIPEVPDLASRGAETIIVLRNTSIVVDYLRGQREQKQLPENVGIAVIYLRYDDPEQTLENLLASLLKQLAQEQDTIPSLLQDLFEQHRAHNMGPSLEDITSVLSSLIEMYAEVFFVVDAFDECSDEVRWELLEKLQQCQPRIRLMITSRFLDSIGQEMEDFEQLEIKANKADLELFIDYRLRKNKNLRRIVEKSPRMRTDIKDAVVRTSENMFLLARLHVESIANAAALSISHVRQKLQTLPTTLDPERRSIAMKTLAWVCYAFRSLSLGELQHALAIEPGRVELDEELLMDGSSITGLCAGLVQIDPGTNVVTLVRYTTKNYFENIRLSRFPGFHATITMSCATYLALKELKDASVWKIVQRFPLACYAAQYMGDHARQNPEEALEPSILQVICQLLSHPDKRKPLLSLLDGLDLIKAGFYSSRDQELLTEDTASTLVEDTSNLSIEEKSIPSTRNAEAEKKEAVLSSIQNTIGETDGDEAWDTRVKRNYMPEVTALHLAASMGLAKVASMLLNEVPNIDAVDESGKTALALAMERGFEKAVEFLVNSGASVDLGSEHGQGVLLLITESDWDKVVETIAMRTRTVLLDGTTNTSQFAIQLLLAAYYGECTAIQRLVNEGDIDIRGASRAVGATALFLAVERSHAAVVQALLDAGVDVNAKDSRGQSSLHRATRRESEGLMKLLLRNGAEVDCKNDEGRTPWSANVRSLNKRLLDILIEAGANSNTKGHQGVSELYDGATNGETELVALMLESGTDPSIKTQFLWAPLHWAAYYGHMDCVKLLISHGAELSPVSDQEATPLDLALRANKIAIVDVLIRAGAQESRAVVASSSSTASNEKVAIDDWSTSLHRPNDNSGL
ncbi:Ankyrin repeat-containing domain [Lasallia pustulata]|uniref:Ankyrin repeat-containing domain n=1 Tax=Lasallia pustulata TaxID=136370 RepID=A0A1W5D432_9LECA|nr:Ankyrin repeat-containing domain [Lasallia pustulata]